MKLEGSYIASKFYSSVRLEAVENKIAETVEYFKFEALLFSCFESESIKKICNLINEKKQVLIDFDNGTAFLIKDKDIRFSKEFYKTMTTSAVENFYLEVGDMSDMNYTKTILGDNKDVEPIF